MSAELIGIIAAAIAVGAPTLASLRSIRQEMRAEFGRVRSEIGSVRTELSNEIAAVRSDLSSEIGSVRTELSNEIAAVRSDLSSEIGSVRTELGNEIAGVRSELRDTRRELRDEMRAGFKELTGRVVNLGDRLSKVEGVIEGMFWSTRNQPPDKAREGAA